jgi:uncharacterized membrane protein
MNLGTCSASAVGTCSAVADGTCFLFFGAYAILFFHFQLYFLILSKQKIINYYGAKII